MAVHPSPLPARASRGEGEAFCAFGCSATCGFPSMHAILTLNGGSSSLRFALFGGTQSLERRLAGKFERIGLPDARLAFTDGRKKEERGIDAPTHLACIPLLVDLIEKHRG